MTGYDSWDDRPAVLPLGLAKAVQAPGEARHIVLRKARCTVSGKAARTIAAAVPVVLVNAVAFLAS
jgi:hypothetical protein